MHAPFAYLHCVDGQFKPFSPTGAPPPLSSKKVVCHDHSSTPWSSISHCTPSPTSHHNHNCLHHKREVSQQLPQSKNIHNAQTACEDLVQPNSQLPVNIFLTFLTICSYFFKWHPSHKKDHHQNQLGGLTCKWKKKNRVHRCFDFFFSLKCKKSTEYFYTSQQVPRRYLEGLCAGGVRNWILTSYQPRRVISDWSESVTSKCTFQNSSHDYVNLLSSRLYKINAYTNNTKHTSTNIKTNFQRDSHSNSNIAFVKKSL